jgi:hypothetical protein
MGDAAFLQLVKDIKDRGEVLESDILPLRRAIGADFHISVEEASILFDLNNLQIKPDSWDQYFVMVITSFLVDQTPPAGYINNINASWLIARIEHDGVVETHTELALLMNILKLASNVTDTLEMFALEQVKTAVLEGRGYLAQDRPLEPGVIGEAEVEIMRRVLYSVASEGGMGISSTEAEFLFDLSDACEGSDNHSSWQKLFVRGIANHLMMVAAWEEPDLDEALRREKWLEDLDSKRPSLGGALDLVKTEFTPAQFIKNLISIFKEEKPVEFTHMRQSDVQRAEQVTETEATWLIDRLNRDGVLSSNEKALLKFLEDECPNIHTSLLPLIKAA